MDNKEITLGTAIVLDQIIKAQEIAEEIEISKLDLLDALATFGYMIIDSETETNFAALAYQTLIRRNIDIMEEQNGME